MWWCCFPIRATATFLWVYFNTFLRLRVGQKPRLLVEKSAVSANGGSGMHAYPPFFLFGGVKQHISGFLCILRVSETCVNLHKKHLFF